MDKNNHNYSTGEPRKHHQYYIPSGDLVLQVEKAIFKIHRIFLSQYSRTLREMFEIPQKHNGLEGTDAMPLVLSGDSVAGWEQVFRVCYRTDPLAPFELTFQESNALLQVAHKYGMDAFENAAVKKLSNASTMDESIQLMLAAQLLSSEEMYQHALKALSASWHNMTFDQAQKIGIRAVFDLGKKYSLHCNQCGFKSSEVVTRGETGLLEANSAPRTAATTTSIWTGSWSEIARRTAANQ